MFILTLGFPYPQVSYIKYLSIIDLPFFLVFVVLEMGWSLICNPDWPQNHGDAAVPVSLVLGLRGEVPHLANNLVFFLKFVIDLF